MGRRRVVISSRCCGVGSPSRAVWAALACLLAARVHAAPCRGRFVVTHAAGDLLRDARAAVPDAIVVTRRSVALTSACRPTTARLGATHLADCEGPQLRLQVTARARCTMLRGTLRAAGGPPTTFVARASRCGDGVVDHLNGERCDDGNTSDGDGCGADCVACAGWPPLASTWDAVQVTGIVRYGCLRCHDSTGAIGGLDLRPSAALAHLVDVPSRTLAGVPRITPADRMRSVFWEKLAKGTHPADWEALPGGGMPLYGALSADELEAVGRWIDAGALDDDVVAGTEAILGSCP